MTTLQQVLKQDTQRLFAQLYSIDIDALTSTEKEQHRELLNDAYLALLRFENQEFINTLNDTQGALTELEQAIDQLAEAFKQEQKMAKKLQLAARGVELIRTIAAET